VPVLIDESRGEARNPWGISFRQGLFNMTSDSHLFRTAPQLGEAGAERHGPNWVLPEGETWVPLYEAKMVNFYDHRAGSYEERGDDRGYRVLPRPTDEQHANPDYFAEPFYWVLQSEVEERLRGRNWSHDWLLGWKDITSATNERTVIAGVIPRMGVGHSFPLFFTERQEAGRGLALYANWNSLALDFIARQKVGGLHLTYMYLKQLPMLAPVSYSADDVAFIAPRALELTYTAHDLAPLAHDLGHEGPPFRWDPERRAWLRAELDAYYARLYGLTRDELRYILDPADVMGPDYPSETFRVLKQREIREYGEYRTARLVLRAWDEQEGGKGP
jgi:hypothetical protein